MRYTDNAAAVVRGDEHESHASCTDIFVGDVEDDVIRWWRAVLACRVSFWARVEGGNCCRQQGSALFHNLVCPNPKWIIL